MSSGGPNIVRISYFLTLDIGHWTLDMVDLAGQALSLVITCRILQMPC